MMRELGGVFGIAVAVAVFAGAGSYASAAAFTAGSAPPFGVGAGLALAGAVAGLALPGSPAHGAPRLDRGGPRPRPGGSCNETDHGSLQGQAGARGGERGPRPRRLRGARASEPDGIRYVTFRLEDGVSFVHVALQSDDGPSPLTELEAFQRFVGGIRDRCDEPPAVSDLQADRGLPPVSPHPVVHLELHTGAPPCAAAFYARAAAVALGADRGVVRLLPGARRWAAGSDGGVVECLRAGRSGCPTWPSTGSTR